MDKIAVLHTAKATVPMLSEMIAEKYPEVKVFNWLDDSILPMLGEDINTLGYAFEKLLYYAEAAEKQGAKVILNACSSVGEFKDYAQGKLKIPVIRIDDAVAELLAEQYNSIGVLATLETTLKPSSDLIKRKKDGISLYTEVVEGAWNAGLSGDKERQNAMIAEAIKKCLKENEVVFLAQASMAEAVKILPGELCCRVYTSPEYGVASLAKFL